VLFRINSGRLMFSNLFTKYITLKCQEKFEDTKGVIRRCKIKKGRYRNIMTKKKKKYKQ
jgi:hypothetical protein